MYCPFLNWINILLFFINAFQKCMIISFWKTYVLHKNSYQYISNAVFLNIPDFKPLFSLEIGKCMQKQLFGSCFWEPESVNQGIFSYLHFPVFLFLLHLIQSCHHFSHCSFWGWIPAMKWNSLRFICWRKGNLIYSALSTLQCLSTWILLGEPGLTLVPFRNAHEELGK